jgi:hypothetical protein
MHLCQSENLNARLSQVMLRLGVIYEAKKESPTCRSCPSTRLSICLSICLSPMILRQRWKRLPNFHEIWYRNYLQKVVELT